MQCCYSALCLWARAEQVSASYDLLMTTRNINKGHVDYRGDYTQLSKEFDLLCFFAWEPLKRAGTHLDHAS